MGNKGSPRLMPWLPIGVVTSANKTSSLAMKDVYPELEQEDVTQMSLLASVKGGDTGTGWNRVDDSWSRGDPWKEFQSPAPIICLSSA